MKVKCIGTANKNKVKKTIKFLRDLVSGEFLPSENELHFEFDVLLEKYECMLYPRILHFIVDNLDYEQTKHLLNEYTYYSGCEDYPITHPTKLRCYLAALVCVDKWSMNTDIEYLKRRLELCEFLADKLEQALQTFDNVK